MIIHNAVEFDYCVAVAIRSLIPVCDEIVVMDAGSTDGTNDILRSLSRESQKVHIIEGKWSPKSGGGGSWLSDLSNEAKSHLRDCTHHIGLQADEVLEPVQSDHFRCEIAARNCMLHRLNFWVDHRHLVPSGRVCSDKVIRCTGISAPYLGDAESLLGDNPVLLGFPRIFHYGFIRRTKEYVAKAKPMHIAFTGSYDPVLDVVAQDSQRGFEQHLPLSQCLHYEGPHPPVAHQWLRERGYTV